MNNKTKAKSPYKKFPPGMKKKARLGASGHLGLIVSGGGSAIVKGTTESGDTQTLVTFADTTKSTMENDTYVTLGLVATKGTNLDKVEFYINRNKVGQSTTNIPTANMKVMAMSVSGDATGQKITTIDYIMAAQDRNVSYS